MSKKSNLEGFPEAFKQNVSDAEKNSEGTPSEVTFSDLRRVGKEAKGHFKEAMGTKYTRENYDAGEQLAKNFEELIQQWNQSRNGVMGKVVNILEKIANRAGGKMKLKSFFPELEKLKAMGYDEAYALKSQHEKLLFDLQLAAEKLQEFETKKLGMDNPTDVHIPPTAYDKFNAAYKGRPNAEALVEQRKKYIGLAIKQVFSENPGLIRIFAENLKVGADVGVIANKITDAIQLNLKETFKRDFKGDEKAFENEFPRDMILQLISQAEVIRG